MNCILARVGRKFSRKSLLLVLLFHRKPGKLRFSSWSCLGFEKWQEIKQCILSFWSFDFSE